MKQHLRENWPLYAFLAGALAIWALSIVLDRTMKAHIRAKCDEVNGHVIEEVCFV